LEVGLAYGISALFILELHKINHQRNGFHIAIEPDEYWVMQQSTKLKKLD
jgi:hypothetical protein